MGPRGFEVVETALTPLLDRSLQTRFQSLLQVVFPSGRHAAVAVDLRRVVQNVGRLVRENGEEGVLVRGVRFCKV